MSFRDFIVLGYHQVLDALDNKSTNYPDAPTAFKARLGNLNIGHKTPDTDIREAGGHRANLVGNRNVFGKVTISPFSTLIPAAGYKLPKQFLTLGASKDIQYLVRPYIREGAVDLNLMPVSYVYNTHAEMIYDMRRAENDDILYTSPPSFYGDSPDRDSYAAYPSNSAVLVGSGRDVLIGGIGRQQFMGDGTPGSKVIVGGSNVDLIYAGNDNDYLVGDVHAKSDNVYFTNNNPSAAAIASVVGTLNKGPFESHNRLIESTLINERSNIPGEISGNINTFQIGQSYIPRREGIRQNSVREQAKLVRNGVRLRRGATAPIYTTLNAWQPLGDLIHGGGGDDIIFGDDDAFDGSELIAYKDNFAGTLEAITNSLFSNNINASWQWKVPDKKLDAQGNLSMDGYLVPQWSGNNSNSLRLGDDILFGGSGNDLIYGGFGSDLIVGGDGFDVIFAPLQILVPGFDPLWKGSTVIYGDRFSSSDGWNGGKDVLTNRQINERRFGLGPAEKPYSNWQRALTPSPDHFVFDAPIFTNSQLNGLKSNFGRAPRKINKTLDSSIIPIMIC